MMMILRKIPARIFLIKQTANSIIHSTIRQKCRLVNKNLKPGWNSLVTISKISTVKMSIRACRGT